MQVWKLTRVRVWLLHFRCCLQLYDFDQWSRGLFMLSWKDFDVNCSVVCNQGDAANAAEIVIVVAASVEAAAFHMHIGCACCAPNFTAAQVVVTYDTMRLIGH